MKIYSDTELAQILDIPVFRLIGETADEQGVECYVVGGFVRDIFNLSCLPLSNSMTIQISSLPTFVLLLL